MNIFLDYETIDLTHPLKADIPTWDGTCGFKISQSGEYSDNPTETKFMFNCLEMRAGIGTHMDAPCHCIKLGKRIADIALSQLILPLIVIDVSSNADPHYKINQKDIFAFEENHGKIPPQCLVIGYTGWSKHWNNPILYRNADEHGQVHFPSFSKEAAEALIERGVSGIGIDTLSPDLGLDGHYPVHQLFLGNDKYIIENIANAHLLPPQGAYGLVLPMKVVDGSEAPVRFVGLIKKR